MVVPASTTSSISSTMPAMALRASERPSTTSSSLIAPRQVRAIPGVRDVASLATVPNPNGLLTADNNIFALSQSSGSFTLATAGQGMAGEITGGAIESSNVDIAEELTELIQKQRAFSSNAKIITTADEMLDETVRLKR